MFLLNLELNLTILGGAEPRLLVNNLGTWSESNQAWIHTGFHRFTEISHIFHIYKYIFNNKKTS